MTNHDTHNCPICAEPFKTDDICATDITEGPCHAACLDGCEVVDLDTGEPTDKPLSTYRYSEVMEPAPPQTKSVLGSIVGPEALTPCAEPLGENISEIGASEGRETGDSGLTALFDNLGSARVAEDTGIAFHNGLRTEARAQASPSRREIGDEAHVEQMPEEETPEATEKEKNGRPTTNGSQPPCAIVEGVADDEDLIKGRSLRGDCVERSPQNNMTATQLKPALVRETGVDAAALDGAGPSIEPYNVDSSGLNERLVTKDPRESDGPDHADDNDSLGCVHELARPARLQIVAGWVVNRKRGDGIFMDADKYDEASAAAEADIHDQGYFAVTLATKEGKP